MQFRTCRLPHLQPYTIRLGQKLFHDDCGMGCRLSGLEPMDYRPNKDNMRSTFLNIGERCNVAGSMIYKKAIVDGDFDKAHAIALKQVCPPPPPFSRMPVRRPTCRCTFESPYNRVCVPSGVKEHKGQRTTPNMGGSHTSNDLDQ